MEYLTGFELPQFLEDRSSKKEEEKFQNEITAILKQRKEDAGAKVNEKALRDSIVKEKMNERQRKIEELKVRVTPLVFADIWRFFDFLK